MPQHTSLRAHINYNSCSSPLHRAAAMPEDSTSFCAAPALPADQQWQSHSRDTCTGRERESIVSMRHHCKAKCTRCTDAVSLHTAAWRAC
eukprot:7565-Heterococcus_DN1.PRE.3